MLSVVDTGPLYAAADAGDEDHQSSLATLLRPDLTFVIPVLAIAEAAYLVASRLGPLAEARFIRGMSQMTVEAPDARDWDAVAALMERHADFPLGAVDASVAVLADRLGTDVIITLDRRHFGALRTPAGAAYRLLPG